MDQSVLQVESRGDATTLITLNRPARRNALNMDLMERLVNELNRLEQSRDCRVVILRGAGPVFCAGLDLIEAADQQAAHRGAEWVARTFQTIANSRLVTIAAVHGAAIAGGAGLMTACDFSIASRDATIAFPEVRRGLVPALVSTLLRHRVRDAELRELLILAEPITAQRAMELGLIYRAVANAELLEQALTLAQTVLLGAPNAVRTTKQLLREMRSTEPEENFARALNIHTQARQSGEANEGLAAFRERRDPDWSRLE